MPESAERHAERKRLGREAARRREAVNVLRIVECGARYTAGQMSNGLAPEQARAMALEMAAEFETAAAVLRRCVRLRPAERRELAVRMAGAGASTRRIAATVGVSDRAVRYYLAGRCSDGQPWPSAGSPR